MDQNIPDNSGHSFSCKVVLTQTVASNSLERTVFISADSCSGRKETLETKRQESEELSEREDTDKLPAASDLKRFRWTL